MVLQAEVKKHIHPRGVMLQQGFAGTHFAHLFILHLVSMF